MEKNINVSKVELVDDIIVGFETQLASRSIMLKEMEGKGIVNPSLIVYTDGRLMDTQKKYMDIFYEMSKTAKIASPFRGSFAVPSSMIKTVKEQLDEMDVELANDLEEIINCYESVKEKRFQEIEKTLENYPEKERNDILNRAKYRYPSIEEIKNFRRIIPSMLVAPLNGPIKDIELLQDRIEADITYRFKKAIFNSLNPLYVALGKFYTKLSNDLPIATKSKNHLEKIIEDLEVQNVNRRDGFTSDVINVMKKYGSEVYYDSTICYVILLNIYNEAYANEALTSLTNLGRMEARELKAAKKSAKNTGMKITYVLKDATIDADASETLSIRDLL